MIARVKRLYGQIARASGTEAKPIGKRAISDIFAILSLLTWAKKLISALS